MDIFLFANFFPYKKAEPFLVNEFFFTKQYAKTITLFTLYGESKDLVIKPSDSITVLDPILNSPKNKKQFLTAGLLNGSPFFIHLKEFFQQQVFLSLKKTYWFITSLLITRTVLSSSSYKQLLSKIEKSDAPVLYFYWGDNLCWIIPYLYQKLKHKNVKVILRLHGSDLYEYLKADYAPLRNQIFAKADSIIPISEYGKDYLSKKYPHYSAKIMVSRLGVFDNGLNTLLSNAPYHVVSVSNMIPLKRIHLIFETLQNAKADVIWHHFGSGVLADDLITLVKTKRQGLQIVFHGHVENKILIEFYKTQPVNLFINLSSTEGLPVSIMEALSFGIPVVATDVGGTSELVNSTNGLLIEPDFEVKELSSKIDSLLALEVSEVATLRQNARITFEEKVYAEKNYKFFYGKIQDLFSKKAKQQL